MKLRNKRTGERIVLIDHIFDNYSSLDEFNKEWESITKPLMIGEEFIDLFKHWARTNRTVCNNADTYKLKFMYDKEKDILWYVDSEGEPSYCIGFNEYSVLKNLKHKQIYSYYDLVGEEKE